MRVTKLFSFSSNWLRKWCEFSDQSQSWGRELCYHFRLSALFVVLTFTVYLLILYETYIMPSYQLPVNTPLKSKLVWKRSWWGEEKRFVWSIQLFIDSFFFLFFFSTMALCNVLQFFVNTGDKRLSSIIVKGERIFQQDEGTDLCSYSNKLVTLWEAPAERGE